MDYDDRRMLERVLDKVESLERQVEKLRAEAAAGRKKPAGDDDPRRGPNIPRPFFVILNPPGPVLQDDRTSHQRTFDEWRMQHKRSVGVRHFPKVSSDHSDKE